MGRRDFLRASAAGGMLSALPEELLAQWDQKTQAPEAMDGLEPFHVAELQRAA